MAEEKINTLKILSDIPQIQTEKGKQLPTRKLMVFVPVNRPEAFLG